MARRNDHTPTELRALILDAARQIITAEGVGALSTRKLAREIGYTSGTLYQHFTDLADIVLHVNAGTMGGLVDAMKEPTRKLPKDPAKRMHAYADIYLNYVTINRNAWNAMFAWQRSGAEEVPEWYSAQIDKLVDLVATCFAELAASKGPAHKGTLSAHEAARMVWASVHSVCALDNGGRLSLIMRTQLEPLVHRLVQIHIDAFV